MATTGARLDSTTAPSSIIPEDPAVPLRLHPLVVLSVSDHVTRMRYLSFHQADDSDAAATAPVIGVLLGQPEEEGGGAMATGITATFEVVFDGADGDTTIPRPTEAQLAAPSLAPATATPLQRMRRWFVDRIDWDAVAQKRRALTAVFPESVVVGWYTVGACLGDLAACAAVHTNMCRLFGADAAGDGAKGGGTRRLVALMMDANPTDGMGAAALPVYLFDTVALPPGAGSSQDDRAYVVCSSGSNSPAAAAVPGNDDSDDTAALVSFTLARYQLRSEEVEHLTMEAVMNIGAEDAGGSAAAAAQLPSGSLRPVLAGAQRSLRLLRLRLQLAVAYVERLQARLGGAGDDDDEGAAGPAWDGDSGDGGLSSLDAEALRQLHLVASQVPSRAPPLPRDAVAMAGPDLSVFDAEAAYVHAAALLALQGQVTAEVARVKAANQRKFAETRQYYEREAMERYE